MLRLGVARLVQRRHVAAQIEDGHVARRGEPPAVGFAQIVGQRAEVFAIALDRVRRSVALDGQELEKSGDGGAHGRDQEVRDQQSEANRTISQTLWPLIAGC